MSADRQRVAMVVLNPCHNDARVLRSARALAAAGADVRVFALGNSRYPAGVVDVDGVEVERLVVRSVLHRVLAVVRTVYLWVRGTPSRACGPGTVPAAGAPRPPAAPAPAVPRPAPPAPRPPHQGRPGRRTRPAASPPAAAGALARRAGAPPRPAPHLPAAAPRPAACAAAAAPAVDDRRVLDRLDRGGAGLGAGRRARPRPQHPARRAPHRRRPGHPGRLRLARAVAAPQPLRAAAPHQPAEPTCVIERRLAPTVDAVITVSPSIAAWLERTYWLRGPVRVVRNTPERSTGAPVRGGLGRRPGEQVVAYSGRFTTGRGLEDMVRALQLLPPHVVLAAVGYGDEEYVASLVALAEQHGVARRVRLLDAVAPQEVAGVVAGADLALVAIEPTCLSYRYSLPNKLFEAVQAGVPVVASRLPDITAVVERYGLGSQFEPGDHEALARPSARCWPVPRPPPRTGPARPRSCAGSASSTSWSPATAASASRWPSPPRSRPAPEVAASRSSARVGRRGRASCRTSPPRTRPWTGAAPSWRVAGEPSGRPGRGGAGGGRRARARRRRAGAVDTYLLAPQRALSGAARGAAARRRRLRHPRGRSARRRPRPCRTARRRRPSCSSGRTRAARPRRRATVPGSRGSSAATSSCSARSAPTARWRWCRCRATRGSTSPAAAPARSTPPSPTAGRAARRARSRPRPGCGSTTTPSSTSAGWSR